MGRGDALSPTEMLGLKSDVLGVINERKRLFLCVSIFVWYLCITSTAVVDYS